MKRKSKKAKPLLVGHLLKSKNPNAKYVDIAVWCPFCKRHHYHTWNVENKRDDVERRVSHCDNCDVLNIHSPLKEEGYYIGIEPKVR